MDGYIHEHESLNQQNIPNGIIFICILFYGNGIDKWDEKYISKTITLKENTVTLSTRPPSSAYGKRIIESGTFSWKFRIAPNTLEWQIMIGIWKVKDEEPEIDTFFTKEGNKGYAFDPIAAALTNDHGYLGNYSEYAERIENHEIACIVEMILDLDNLTLSYIVNDKDYGKAFDVEKCGYRAAVYMVNKGNSISLIP